jgi:uncharacterized tellurite resistance protein B-like protein
MSRYHLEAQAALLEKEFYGGIDRELIMEVQGCLEEQGNETLAMFPRLSNLKILSELQMAEITPKTLMAFSLFPSIHVAWSDGELADKERNAILKAAESIGVSSGSPAYGLLDSWLNKKPTDELFSAWRNFVSAIRPALSENAFQELRDAATRRARSVAEAAGGILGILRISASEEKAINELERAFTESDG